MFLAVVMRLRTRCNNLTRRNQQSQICQFYFDVKTELT